MKHLLFAALLCLTSVVPASELRLDKVVLPLYLHGSDTDVQIAFETVPFATFGAHPEWTFSAISRPFIPPTDGTWKDAHDVNLASLYRISVSGGQTGDNADITVTIDATKAAVPEGYPFTIGQVIDAIVTCVKTMHPPRPAEDGKFEITIKRPGGKPKARD